jgi:hypothetical protein
MNTLSAVTATVKPAARVLFDSASFVHHAPDFGTHAAPDLMTVEQEMAYWDGVAAKKKAEYAAREVVVQATARPRCTRRCCRSASGPGRSWPDVRPTAPGNHLPGARVTPPPMRTRMASHQGRGTS